MGGWQERREAMGERMSGAHTHREKERERERERERVQRDGLGRVSDPRSPTLDQSTHDSRHTKILDTISYTIEFVAPTPHLTSYRGTRRTYKRMALAVGTWRLA